MLAVPTGLHFYIAALCLEESVVAVDEIWEKCKLMIKVSRPTANWLVDLDEVWPKNDKKYGAHFIPVDIICKKSYYNNCEDNNKNMPQNIVVATRVTAIPSGRQEFDVAAVADDDRVVSSFRGDGGFSRSGI